MRPDQPDSGPRQRCRANPAENPRPKLAAGEEPDDQREREIKLLFDRQRPRDPQSVAAKVHRADHPEVLCESPEKIPRRMCRSQPRAVTHALCQKQERRNGEEDCGINRDDPEKTACVEDLEIVAGLARIQEDSADEEAGQHKEEVHAAPS